MHKVHLGMVIAVAGGFGCWLRYHIALLLSGWSGTLCVNLMGSLLTGLFYSMPLDENIRKYLTTGLLGGLTTFSAFSLDTLLLIQKGRLSIAIAYVIASVVGSLLLAWIGMLLGQSMRI